MKSMNIIWSINLFNFEQKRSKDSTCANCVVVRKIPDQALIGSYYNGLIHQDTKNCLLMRSLSIFSFFEFTSSRVGSIQLKIEGRAACREGAQSMIEIKDAKGARKLLDP